MQRRRTKPDTSWKYVVPKLQAATRRLADDLPGVRLVTLSPLAVKGKREPLTVLAAEKAGG